MSPPSSGTPFRGRVRLLLHSARRKLWGRFRSRISGGPRPQNPFFERVQKFHYMSFAADSIAAISISPVAADGVLLAVRHD
ncbi:hypothetical protein LZ31DRAFT_549935 [Colletotrichum somersetense]|nr:hypothetical protein LZ31DRAFT_549935 [Colletotrichum somersetense]